ncbi:FHA domain-containing protein [Nakamurella aerolata]|uniref:FHA domain-containing protein n=1 Tax=Nakamurella aerolata TaxID=1656892 RepID=A0A849A7Y0_9ACTN|nr:FHA domain-containing protein [Nakamurella aerolata]
MTDHDSAREQNPGQPAAQDPATTSVFRAIPTGEPEKPGEQTLTGLEALRPGTALLVVKRGPNAGSRFTLEAEQVSAGRHPESEIFLDDVTVSRRHAEFRRIAGGYEVRDVGSLNGTLVNREPVEAATLSNGDEVQIGKFRLVYLTAENAGNQPADDSAAAGTNSPSQP